MSCDKECVLVLKASVEILASIDLLGESRNTMHLEVFRGQITLWSGDAGDLRARDAVLAVTGDAPPNTAGMP